MPHILQLLLLLVIIIVCAKSAGTLASRYGQPAVFGEILVGLILGPTLLNILGWDIFKDSGNALTIGTTGGSLHKVIGDLAEIGVILLMFVAGMETNLKEMKRVGKVAFWAAFGGVIGPFIGAFILAHQFNHSWSESAFIGAILTATSVSISAQTLMELNQLKSKEGSTILGAAVIDDVMGIIVLSLVVAFIGQKSTSGGWDIALICVKMTWFLILFIWLGVKFLEPLTEKVSRLPVSQALMAFVVAVTFFYAWAAQYFGQMASITGSYIAGVLFAQTKFKKQIDAGIHPITYSFFVPVFFIGIGLQANARDLGNNLAFVGMVLMVAVFAKVVGCGIGSRLTGFNNKESLRVGVGMISRGEVGLIVASYGLTNSIINQDIYSVMVIMVLFTTMITPLLLRLVFPKTREVEAPYVFESIAHLEDEENDKE